MNIELQILEILDKAYPRLLKASGCRQSGVCQTSLTLTS
jgi:hypothetical protein